MPVSGSASGRSVGGGQTVTLPMAAAGMSWEDLLVMGRNSLRCIPWRHVTYDLMKTNGACSSWRDITKLLQTDEKVDFFMSHSWHDDCDEKYIALAHVAEEFHIKHGREPTFWLDKVCIDQANISDGLRVLPVNVMACQQMLVLCGTSYMKRLWCVWELFTLLAFRSMEHATERLYFVSLDGQKDSDPIGQLATFDVSACKCYDPNEQNRLVGIITAMGITRFNDRMHALGDKCEESRHRGIAASIALTRGLGRGSMTYRSSMRTSQESGLSSASRSMNLVRSLLSGMTVKTVLTGDQSCSPQLPGVNGISLSPVQNTPCALGISPITQANSSNSTSSSQRPRAYGPSDVGFCETVKEGVLRV